MEAAAGRRTGGGEHGACHPEAGQGADLVSRSVGRHRYVRRCVRVGDGAGSTAAVVSRRDLRPVAFGWRRRRRRCGRRRRRRRRHLVRAHHGAAHLLLPSPSAPPSSPGGGPRAGAQSTVPPSAPSTSAPAPAAAQRPTTADILAITPSDDLRGQRAAAAGDGDPEQDDSCDDDAFLPGPRCQIDRHR